MASRNMSADSGQPESDGPVLSGKDWNRVRHNGWQGERRFELCHKHRVTVCHLREDFEQLHGCDSFLLAYRVSRSPGLLLRRAECVPSVEELRNSGIARARHPRHCDEIFHANAEVTCRSNRALECRLIAKRGAARNGRKIL